MPSVSPERQRRLLAVAIACAFVFVADIVMLNIVGEVSSGLWLFAVPVALLLVPLIGLVALFMLLADRRGRGVS